MLRESSKAWSNGSEAYSSDPEEEEEEEDMVFGENDQDGVSEEMMDLSDLPTALFACGVHDAVFEEDAHRVSQCCVFCAFGVCVPFESSCWMCQHAGDSEPRQQVHDVIRSSGAALLIAHTETHTYQCGFFICQGT